jgi:hypothetical protein
MGDTCMSAMDEAQRCHRVSKQYIDTVVMCEEKVLKAGRNVERSWGISLQKKEMRNEKERNY